MVMMAAEKGVSKSSMIDQLMRANNGLSRALLRELPLARLKQLYLKLFPGVTVTPESTAKIDTPRVEPHSDECTATLQPTVQADRNPTHGLPLTTPLDSRHISNNGVYVNLNKVLDKYYSITDPIKAEAY